MTQPTYASWMRRAVGFFFDLLPVLLISAIANISFVTAGATVDPDWVGSQGYLVEVSGPGASYYVLHAIALIYWFANKGLLEGATGRSVAKRLLDMRTVSEQSGHVIGPWRGLTRSLLVYVEFASIALCGLGLILWIWPLWEPKTQALLSDK
ncbi:MAG: RDD family protein, partial [Actinobacteria bacterium]|nr:RDD family protein [Actinomycetota bacterium]